MPDAGARFMSLMAVSQDHYTSTVYGAGPHTFVRTRSVPANPHRHPHAGRSGEFEGRGAGPRLAGCDQGSQKGTGTLALPTWDPASQKKVRDALLVLGSTLPDFKKAFGSKDQVDPIRHLIGSRVGVGRQPRSRRDLSQRRRAATTAKRPTQLTVKDVPVEAFWSVSLYNAQGYYEKIRTTPTP